MDEKIEGKGGRGVWERRKKIDERIDLIEGNGVESRRVERVD